MRPASRITFALGIFFGLSSLSAQPTALSLQRIAEAVGPAASRQALFGISARAEASGPRGAFVSEMLSFADGTARFRLTKGNEITELLLVDGEPFARSGSASPVGGPLQPAEAAMAGFVRGHEVHRMLLDLDLRFRVVERATAPGCLALAGPDASGVTLCRAAGSDLPATLELGSSSAAGGGSVTLELGDWRGVLGGHGVRLPFAVSFLHAGERHDYRYTEVLPFRIAPGVPLPEDREVLLARLDDLATLAAAHERVLEAHRRSDLQMLLADAPQRSLQSGRGVLQETGPDELAARLGPYLASTRFSRYEDVAPPVVALSTDGTLGWLACQIEAAGTQLSPAGSPEPLAFGFSWVELYARQNGKWQSIGNASSVRPPNS